MEMPHVVSFTSCSVVVRDFQHPQQQVFDRSFAANLFAALYHVAVGGNSRSWVIVQPGHPVKVSPKKIGLTISSEMDGVAGGKWES